jgi:hypoxanthine phosphoribosyltransferase
MQSEFRSEGYGLSNTAVMEERILLNPEQIQKRIRELARQISDDYRGKTCCVVGVLENGFMFMSDLVRNMDVPVVCQFVKPHTLELSAGGASRKEINYSPSVDVRNQHVLLVEGLVQSGITSDYLMHHFKAQGAASVKLAAFLDKSSSRRVSLRPDYYGFVLDESFVAGYGLGSPHLNRNLPYVRIENSRFHHPPDETVR